MEKKSWRKGLGWLLFLEVAIAQPGFAQEEVAAEPAPTPVAEAPAPAAAEPTAAPDAVAASEAVASPAAVDAPAEEAAAAEAPAPEQAEAAEEKTGVKNRMIEEVVVTAQKREQNLQEVPSSVTAFSGGQLDAQGISDIKDMQLVTPGLTFDSMASYSIIFIRGIGGDAFQAAVDSSVATYIDGLYLPFTFSSAQALGDVSQVEVLKGPQGTLYGRNAIAGAILVKLKEPSNTWRGDFLQQFGNYNDSKTKAGISGPVPFTNDTLAFSVSGLYEDRDSFTIYYPDPDQKYKNYRNTGFRGALKWEPIDDLKISTSYYMVKQKDSDSVATVLLKTSPAFSVLTAHDVAHESGNYTNVGVTAKTKIFSAVAEYKGIDYFDTKLVYGHTTANSTILFDYDSAPEPVLDISAIPNTAKADSVELIFNSNPASSPEWLEWIGGLYYEDSTKTGRYPVTVDLVATGIGTAGANLGDGVSPICATLTDLLGFDCSANTDSNTNPLLQLPLESGIDTKAYAAYGQLTFKLTEQLSAVAGARIASEKRDLTYSRVGFRILEVPVVDLNSSPLPIFGDADENETGITVINYRPETHSWRSLTPNAGLNYKVTDDILVYYKYSEAFKSGNYNGLNINNPPTRIEPETASSSELGFKTELFDDRSLKFNGAFFSTRVENAQIQTLALTSGSVTSLQNATQYTVKGFESEINWFATESLVFSLSGVYLNGKYANLTIQQFSPVTYLYLPTDVSGNKTVRTPKFSGTAAASYTFPFVFGLEGEVGADVYYNDGYYFDPLNTLEQESYYILNARLGVFDPRTNIRVTAFGKNLTDELFYANKYRQDFGDTGIFGAARTYGVTFNWSFGS